MRISDWSSDVCSSDLVNLHDIRILEVRVASVIAQTLSDSSATSDQDFADSGEAVSGPVVLEKLFRYICARHATQSTDLVARHPSERVGFAREYSFAHKDAGSLAKCLLCPLLRIAILGEAEAGAGFAFAGVKLLHQDALARLQQIGQA